MPDQVNSDVRQQAHPAGTGGGFPVRGKRRFWTTGNWTTGSACLPRMAATWSPPTDLPEGYPQRDLVLIDDDITRLRARAVRLNSRHAHREYPWSRTRRFISNVRVEEADNGELRVTSNILVYRFRSGEGAPYVGSIDYVLRQDGGDLKIAYRRAVLDLEALSWHGALSIIF